VKGGALEVKATFRSQLVIMRMKGRQSILGGCCTWSILYWVYAVLGVCVLGICCTRCMLYSVSTHDHDMEEIERDD